MESYLLAFPFTWVSDTDCYACRNTHEHLKVLPLVIKWFAMLFHCRQWRKLPRCAGNETSLSLRSTFPMDTQRNRRTSMCSKAKTFQPWFTSLSLTWSTVEAS